MAREYGIANHYLSRDMKLSLPLDAVMQLKDSWADNRIATAANLDSLSRLADSVNDRVLAYIGWLLTNPVFLAERDQLRNKLKESGQAFGILPDRCIFPLRPRPYLDNNPHHREEFDNEKDAPLLQDIVDFLSRWGLVAMDSWDLPSPQGLLEAAAGMEALILEQTRIGQTLFIPNWFKLEANGEVLSRLKDQQQAVGGDNRCLPGETWPVGHTQTYLGMFFVLHYEHALRQRLTHPPTQAEKGLIALALAEYLEIRVPVNEAIRRSRKIEKDLLDDITARVRQLRRDVYSRLAGKLSPRLRR